jgi:cobalamin synthase
MAWLISLPLGIDIVTHSTSQLARRRVQEAALAGAWLGLLQGLLFWLVAWRLGPIQADEQASALLISLGMLLVGILAGAGLAAFTAGQFERKRAA